MFQKNDKIELVIEDLSIDGEGIGKADGFTFFVKDTVPGDRITATVMKLKKTYGYAKLQEIKQASEDRVPAPCPVAKQCGGCVLQEMSYPAQLRFKQNLVRNALLRIAGFSEEQVNLILRPIIGMEETAPFRYRNKALFPVGYTSGQDNQDRLTAGFYAARTHSLIPVEDCLLGIEENRIIVEKILAWMKAEENEPYDEESGEGCIRHIMIRKGFRTGEILVCLVINRPIQGGEALIETLSKVPGLVGISLNFNQKKTNVIFGDRTFSFWGKPSVLDKIGDVKFEISTQSFFQVNPVQTEKLYQKVLEYAALTGKETVWDLFCGIGTISLFLAKCAKKVYGVEVVPQAVEDAKKNASINGIKNAVFYAGKAEEKYLPEKPDVIVVDPPRKGCELKLLHTICENALKRIVYVSCDPATLARDLEYLCENGYRLEEATPIDMFPMTRHVETCVLLSHQQIDKYKTVDYTPDGSYMKNVNRHATYKEINEYVEDKYGFKLHSAYIAQVKREMGIEMGENYNLSKSDDYEPRQVTPEKRAAIIDALKHFNMIE
ncbi:MAG: 23S rRNA (uracil(1939)-C(5))-methyltransferase RlmD [Lachnospiraceae bacterium]|nr:23S rRNA (uracil(1939)-C(5))-methyltransferase RlmD [Lachnospiraceae bacterium]